MPVLIHCDLNGRVSHLLLHVYRALALLKQQRGKGMPKVVEANLTQASGLQEAVEGQPEGIVKVGISFQPLAAASS